MAAVAGPRFCTKGPLMSKKPRRAATARAGNVPALRRINSEHARPYPPDGQSGEWWQRLKNAFGTTSSAFVDASLQQLIAAARLPNSGISETAVNASLAFIEGAKPQDEVECALVMQMACTHTAAMAVLSRLGGGHTRDPRILPIAYRIQRWVHRRRRAQRRIAWPGSRGKYVGDGCAESEHGFLGRCRSA
jgi:hypothetical protein